MEHLSNVQHVVRDQLEMATHVVTNIQYGADAYFIFDRKRKEQTTKMEAGGAFKGKANLAMFEIKGKITGDFAGETKQKSDEFNCTYYGEFKIQKNPTTIEEAKAILEQLTNAYVTPVPKTVYLFPLAKLSNKAAKLLARINDDLLNSAEEQLLAFTEARTVLTKALQDPNLLKHFDTQRKEIDSYLAYLKSAEGMLQQRLCEVLPGIRGGSMQQIELSKVLQMWAHSLFNPQRIKQALYDFVKEVSWLSVQLNNMLGSGVILLATSEDCYDFDDSVVMALEFNVADFRSNLLSYCKEFLVNPSKPFDEENLTSSWFGEDDLRNKAKMQVKRFLNCVRSIEDPKQLVAYSFLQNTKFVCVSNKQKTKRGAVPENPISIVVYKNGKQREISLPEIEDAPEVFVGSIGVQRKLSFVHGEKSVDPFGNLYTWIEADFCGREVKTNENEEILFKEEGEMEIMKEKAIIDVTSENAVPRFKSHYLRESSNAKHQKKNCF